MADDVELRISAEDDSEAAIQGAEKNVKSLGALDRGLGIVLG